MVQYTYLTDVALIGHLTKINVNLEVCHPCCVKWIMQCIMCIYLHTHAVKNTTICQMVSLCNMRQNVIYNYMFRPCKWTIIRLFVEPVRWLYSRSLVGGTRSCLTSYLVGFV